MPDYLALVEVDQRQEFILRADKLREMLGASRLIEDTIDVGKRTCRKGVESFWPVSGVIRLTSNSLPSLAETLVAIRRHFHSTGLSATFLVEEYKLDTFTTVLNAMEHRMRARKNAKSGEDGSPRCPLFAQCGIQGLLPANEWRPRDREDRRGLRSSDTAVRFSESRTYRQHIRRIYDPQRQYHSIPKDLDDLIISETDSYLALIKADGDGLGRLLPDINWNMLCAAGQTPAHAAEAFATHLDSTIHAAIASAIQTTLSADLDKRSKAFPILPLVTAGDDLWILCRRDLAFQFAIELGQTFELLAAQNAVLQAAIANARGDQLSLSFGLLFAKKGFPFDAQLDLAQELEKNAKAYRRDSRGQRLSGCLDYHWLESSGREKIADARVHSTSIKDGTYTFQLATRPWTIQESANMRDAAIGFSRLPRRKRHQLDEILRYGYQLSDLAYLRWRRGLLRAEQQILDDAIRRVPQRLQPAAADSPWRTNSKGEFESVLPELAELADILSA